MRVLISGRHGLVGSAIADLLEQRGDHVSALVRSTRLHVGDVNGDVAYDIDAQTIDAAALADGSFDAVVHLAGEPLDARWSPEKKRAIVDSRVAGTRLIADAITQLDNPPSVFAVASATGAYGDAGDALLTEQSPIGDDFLATTVAAWEQAADSARDAGIRTVHMRMGVVQSPRSGALARMLLPFRLGLGGPIGSGSQWFPWVGLHDVARMWCFALDTPDITGAVNAVGPTPCTNREYAKVLARILHRPAIMPIPASALSLRFGRELVHTMLTVSQKVVPARLEAMGFEFGQRDIEAALRHELQRA